MNAPETCGCLEMGEAMQEGAVIVHQVERGEEVRSLYLLPHPSGDEDEARLMLFCPFCGLSAGHGLTFRGELWADN